MIKLTKRPLPDGVTIKRENDYRSGVVFKMLTDDFFDKCYICEDNLHKDANVEHIIPHRGDKALQYDWDNLFLACSYCNNVKGDDYIGIINPLEVDPEELFELSLNVDDELREKVVIHKIKGGKDVDITICLLDAVYNGAKTDMKNYARLQLLSKLSNELIWFYEKFNEYKDNPDSVNREVLVSLTSDASPFAMFKRGIMRGFLKRT
jgi:hypothetical protein